MINHESVLKNRPRYLLETIVSHFSMRKNRIKCLSSLDSSGWMRWAKKTSTNSGSRSSTLLKEWNSGTPCVSLKTTTTTLRTRLCIKEKMSSWLCVILRNNEKLKKRIQLNSKATLLRGLSELGSSRRSIILKLCSNYGSGFRKDAITMLTKSKSIQSRLK